MAATILLFLISSVSAYITPPQTRIRSSSIRPTQTIVVRKHSNSRKISAREFVGVSRRLPSNNYDDTPSTTTQLSLMGMMMDPSDIIQHTDALHHTATNAIDYHTTSTTSSALDFLSSSTLTLASKVIPNHSLAPLPETIQSVIENAGGGGGGGSSTAAVVSPEVIPDIMSMPGGAPRSGNAFLSGSFRELYGGVLPSPPLPTSESSSAIWNSMGGTNMNSDGTLVVPAKELDMIGRYADLLSRVPLAAAVYALIDFFVINAEEDLAIAEFMLREENGEYEGDEDAALEAIMDVESKVVLQRIVGLISVVIVTVVWSLISYHPVPFGEL